MSPQIIRRRAGSHDIRRAGEQTVHLLESGFTFRTMSDRLQAGAKAMRQGIETGKPLIPTVGIENREDQNAIIAKLLVYIEEAAAASRNALQPTTRARLVAAARTGKTIVMIRAVSLLGLRTVILAPSTTIVEKTVAEFRAKLPGVPVGAYYGDAKDIVNNGVTVATYQTIASHAKRGILPRSIRDSALVFTDEGHETMTEYRQDSLDAFDPQTPIIAFTATPDYNREKVLAVFYPYLIDEIRLMEASQKGLLAPGRMRWRPLEVDASHVHLISRKTEENVVVEDYDERELGKVMAQVVVFEACRQMRYDETSEHPYLKDEDGKPIVIEHAKLKTMICCPTTDMARELFEWLCINRPTGTPAPGLVLGNTPPEIRRHIIAEFRAGRIDTIINVRVLLRGFDDPMLKLLIDLSASVSPVNAEQKFCRPLTKVGDLAGIIAVLYPRGLRPAPILPTAVLGPSFVGDDTREFFKVERAMRRRKSDEAPLEVQEVAADEQAVELKVTKPVPKPKLLKVKKVVSGRELNVVLRPPTFNPDSYDEVRAVLWTSHEFMRCFWHGGDKYRRPSRSDFRQMLFEHESFVGFGETFLRFCKLGSGTVNFERWLNKHVPEFGVLIDEEPEVAAEPVDEAALAMRYHEVLMSDLTHFPDPDSLRFEDVVAGRVIFEDYVASTDQMDGVLSQRQIYVVERCTQSDSLAEIGFDMGLSRERVRQIWIAAIKRLRADLRIPVYGDVED